MGTLRYGREVRWLFQAALLIFLVTVALGMAGGMGIITFSEEREVLTHLHSGVIGWITLGILAAGLWLYGGTGPREDDGDWVGWTVMLLVGAVPLFVLAWWLDSWPFLAVTGSLVLLGIVLYVGWLLREAARIGYGALTTPQLGLLVGLVVLIVGSAIGVLIAVQEATAAFELPVSAHFTHAETQISAYLVLAAMTIAYWRLRGNDRTRGGTWMVWLLFAAGAIIAVSLLANSIEGTVAFIPLDLAAFGIFLALAWRRIVWPGWLVAGSARHYAIAIPFALVYLAIFIYLILGLTVLGLWADPSQIPANIIPAASHPLFVGMLTNTLFGLLIDLDRHDRAIGPWADHIVFWGMNLAVAGFTVAILVEADEWFKVVTPVLGLALVLGIATHLLRLASSPVSVGASEASTAA